MSKTSKHVIILGAGIGGLTTAHELAKHGFDVTVYERNEIVGGLARSKYHTHKNNTYPVEYSWRVYGTHYKNLHRILGEIPLSRKKKLSVTDNLIRIKTYLFPRFNKEALILPRQKEQGKMLQNFTLKDKYQILNEILYCITMSTDRMDGFDSVKWKKHCAYMSKEAKKYIVRIWGPVLGMDPSHMSFPVIARMMKVLLGGFTGSASGLFVMDRPTNDGWFDEWTTYLESTGNVEIKTNHEIEDIIINDKTIDSVIVRDKENDEVFHISGDDYVCALPAEAIAKIVEQNDELNDISDLKNMIPLAKTCRQLQVCVQMFLDQQFTYPVKEKNVLYLPDTPWALIIEPQAMIWGKTFSSDKRVKSVLSVGICQTDLPGIHHKKPFYDCTEKEIVEETLAQMMKSYNTSITMADGSVLSDKNVILSYLWDSYTFNKAKKKMDTWEPKFSNNAKSLDYQPDTETEIENLFFATAYTKTKRFIYSMEAAAEAGTHCANAIAKKHRLGPATKIHPFHASPLPFRPLAFIDKLLHSLDLPHLSRLFFKSSVLLTFIYLIVLGYVAYWIYQLPYLLIFAK